MRVKELSTRLAVFVILPIASVVAIGGWWVTDALEEAFERRLQREVEMVARALRLPVSDAMESERPEHLRRALESAFTIGRVYSAQVYDETGTVVASLGERVELLPPRRTQRGERLGEYRTVGERTIYSYFVPLEDSHGTGLGTLLITRRQRDFQEFSALVRTRAGIVVAVGILLMVLVVSTGYRRAVGGSLAAFGDAIRRIESGDRAHRATIDRPTEVARVARSFNTMLDTLHTAEELANRERLSRVALEERLRHAERLAAIGRLAAGVAHELGTPLSVLDGHAQRILRRRQTEPRDARAVESIRTEAARMERLVRQLLDYGRSDTRQRVPASLSRVVQTAIDSVAPEATERGVTIERPRPSAPDVHVVADEGRLTQAVTNLISNAVHAAEHRVTVSWHQDASAVNLAVDDDGAGVDEDLGMQIFEPFITTKQAHEGTGLGLAIVSAVAREHGGSIRYADSALGGARFVLAVAIPEEEPRK